MNSAAFPALGLQQACASFCDKHGELMQNIVLLRDLAEGAIRHVGPEARVTVTAYDYSLIEDHWPKRRER